MKQLFTLFFLTFSFLVFSQESVSYKKNCKDLLLKSGQSFLDLKNDESIRFANEALSLATHNNDNEFAAKAYNLIGLNYADFSDLSKAIEAYKSGIERANATNNDTIKSWLTNNLANTYCYNELDFNEGVKYYKLALKYAQKLNDDSEVVFTKLNLVSALFRVANYDEGIVYLVDSKDFVENNDNLEAKISFNSLYADYYNNAQNDFNKADFYYQNAFNLSNQNDVEYIKSHIADLYNDISNFYSKHKNYEKAFYYLQKSDSLNNSIYNSERISKVAKESNEVDKSEIERNLFLANQDKLIQEEKLRDSKLIVTLFIVIFSILMMLLFSTYRNNRLKKETNIELKKANEELIKAKEEAEQASNIKSQFISTISHELRTPLYGVIGTTDIIEEEHPELANSSHLKALKFSANYLLSLVNDILKVYKIEENKVILEDNIFNLVDVIENIKESLETISRKNNNKIHVLVDAAIPEFLIGDKIRLSQIIINLMSNSLKFTHNGKVTITADLEKKENGLFHIKFKVIDTGIGIPKKYQESVFDKFVQIERREDDYQGTGLGLTIVKKLIGLFNGKISLESEEGKGTTFTFVIPLKSGVDEAKQFIQEVEVDLSESKSYKVLVVEDNKINQIVTKRLLENHKFECEIVDDGFQAIDILEEKEFDAILMDINMPKINGFETTKIIRKKGYTIPVIAVTAFEKQEIVDKAREAQINDVIAKPFEAYKLFRMIRKYVENSEDTKDELNA